MVATREESVDFEVYEGDTDVDDDVRPGLSDRDFIDFTLEDRFDFIKEGR